MLTRSVFTALALTLALASAGCEDEKKKTAAAAADAGASTQPLLDGKLGEAVAEAEAEATAKNKAAPAKGSAGDDGPPEKGVFEAAAADKALPRGAPPKIEILGEGSNPKVSLAPKLEPGAARKVILTLGLRAQAPIDVDFAVEFKVEKSKDDKKAGDAAKKDEAPAAGAASGIPVVGKIVSATVTSQRGGGDELDKLFGKLKGTSIRYMAQPDSSARDLSYDLGKQKDADPGLEAVVQQLLEAMSIMIAPLPSKPIGNGAYWMVTDRAPSSGVDAIRYRVFRVTKIDGGQVSLSMDLRQYAADPTMHVPGAQKDVSFSIDRFDSQGKGDLVWASGSFLPVSADVGSQLQALVIPPGQTNQRGQVATEVHLKLGAPATAQ